MMKKETRSIELRELSEPVAGDPGGFTAYASTFYTLNSYNNIMMPGAFLKTRDEFLRRGFTAQSHDWGYSGVIGYPVSAEEDEIGLLCETKFHSTEDAQMVRTKAKERLDAGKDVFTSIGFITVRDLWVDCDEYGSVLPSFIPADKLEALMPQITKCSCIRLVFEVDLYEYSIVTAPADSEAEVIEVRGANPENTTNEEPAGGPRAGLRFAEELDAAHAAVEAVGSVVKRQRDLVEKRAGRAISATRRATLQGLLDALTPACGTLKALLDETAPAEEEANDAPLTQEVLHAQKSVILANLGVLRLGMNELSGVLQ
jgi:HK97 family phage prohead protease